MRIWIMGDSWGDEWGSGSMQGAKPSESLSHTLATEFDCAVINLCRGGIGNGLALDILKRAISKGETAPTHVIQFWTEPLRDWNKYYKNTDELCMKELLQIYTIRAWVLQWLPPRLTHWLVTGR